jgi:hypothetical protein
MPKPQPRAYLIFTGSGPLLVSQGRSKGWCGEGGGRLVNW